MKPIVAKKQVNLGPARCWQLAMAGMVHRLFRSLITVAILALAVAFLLHTLAYSLIAHSTKYDAYQEIKTQRQLGTTVNRLIRPDTLAVVVQHFADRNGARVREYKAWGDLDDAAVQQTIAIGTEVEQAASYFAALSSENKAVLMGDLEPIALFRRLQETAHYELFMRRMEELGVSAPLGGAGRFRTLIKNRWPTLTDVVDRIREGHNAAIDRVDRALAGESIRQVLVSPPEDFLAVLESAGFTTESFDLDALSNFATRVEEREVLQSALAVPSVRSALSRRLDVSPTELSLHDIFAWLEGDEDSAAWFSETLAEAGKTLPGERLTDLAAFYLRSQQLQDIAGTEPPTAEAGLFSLGGRLGWLILLAFFVCIVGVANAMLMSVTERFTEIATMKCLGALDGFVMMMFVFEAAIQGLVGGVIGILLGALLAFLRGFVEFGSLLSLGTAGGGQVVLAALLSLLTGVFLAVIAAVGPSLVAARLAPMEAMRVE